MISVTGLLSCLHNQMRLWLCTCTSAGSIVLCKYWERSIHECTPAFDWPDDMLQETWFVYKQVQAQPLIGEYSHVIIRHVTWAYENFRSFTEPLWNGLLGEKINRIHQNKQFYTKQFLGVDPLTPLPTLTLSKYLFWKGGAWKKVTPTNIPIPAPEYTRNSFMFLKLGCFSIYEVNE